MLYFAIILLSLQRKRHNIYNATDFSHNQKNIETICLCRTLTFSNATISTRAKGEIYLNICPKGCFLLHTSSLTIAITNILCMQRCFCISTDFAKQSKTKKPVGNPIAAQIKFIRFNIHKHWRNITILLNKKVQSASTFV